MNTLSINNQTNIEVLPESYQSENFFKLNFDQRNSMLILKGWSVSPELRDIYIDLLPKLRSHIQFHGQLRVFINFELFNASTCKFIFTLIKILNTNHAAGKKVAIKWLVNEDNDEMIDTALDYSVFCDFPFHIQMN